jgi:proprotein convertase subtilisin/kexin type 5
LKCNTCFGPSPNQCLSCSNNSYLLGNTCVRQCPAMSVPSINLCVPSCPGGFYSVMSTKTCSSCSKGCTVCTGPLQSNCILDSI